MAINLLSQADSIERKRIQSLLKYEKLAYKNGFKKVVGIDEVGRGCLAGPVVACAYIAKPKVYLPGVNDSKKLSFEKRCALFDLLINNCQDYAIGVIDPDVIDDINIYWASIEAMKIAFNKLNAKPDIALIDGVNIENLGVPTQKIIRGDALSYSIAAASIVAKHIRDQMMIDLHRFYPHYGFNEHKGYATKKHIEAIKEWGITKHHRVSFKLCSEKTPIK
jgi:ribonuclease HII